MTDEPVEVPQEQATVQLPGARVVLRSVDVTVSKIEDSDDRILTIGPFLVELVVPMGGDVAREISKHLSGGLVLASTVPRMDVPRTRGR